MNRFTAVPTGLDGLIVLQRDPIGDDRGFLERLYCGDELAPYLGQRQIAQANHTLTKQKGTIRGMHFQMPPHAETKMVNCLKGEVFDVAIDLRKNSPTFLQWHAEVLTPSNFKTLLIPEGFGHGFQTLTDDCEMLYLHTQAYAPNHESGLHALDPAAGIDWPLPPQNLSERDNHLATVDNGFKGITV